MTVPSRNAKRHKLIYGWGFYSGHTAKNICKATCGIRAAPKERKVLLAGEWQEGKMLRREKLLPAGSRECALEPLAVCNV